MSIKSINPFLLMDIFESNHGGAVITILVGFVVTSMNTLIINDIQVQFSRIVLREENDPDIIFAFWFSDHWESNVLELSKGQMTGVDLLLDQKEREEREERV